MKVEKSDKMEKGFDLDTILVPGQRVRIVVNVDVSLEVDISDYLENSDDTEISVEELQTNIENNFDIDDIQNEYNDVDIVPVSATTVEIL